MKISILEKMRAPSRNVFCEGLGFDGGALKLESRLDRTAACVDVAAVRAGSGAVFEMRVAVLALHYFAAVRGADRVVGHRVVVVDVRAVGHLPVPAVRTALGHEVDPLASSTSQRDLARNEPRTLAHVLRVSAGERSSDVAVAAPSAVQRVGQETECGHLAHVGIPFSCHSLSAPFCCEVCCYRATMTRFVYCLEYSISSARSQAQTKNQHFCCFSGLIFMDSWIKKFSSPKIKIWFEPMFFSGFFCGFERCGSAAFLNFRGGISSPPQAAKCVRTNSRILHHIGKVKEFWFASLRSATNLYSILGAKTNWRFRILGEEKFLILNPKII